MSLPPLLVSGRYYLLTAQYRCGRWGLSAHDLVLDTTITAQDRELCQAIHELGRRLTTGEYGPLPDELFDLKRRIHYLLEAS